MKRFNLIGQRFGKLTVIADGVPLERSDGATEYTSVCRCDCGTVKTLRNRAIRAGGTVSCGCRRKTRLLKHGFNTGAGPTKAYQSWIDLRKRCHNPASTEYHVYGGAGICVCAGLDDFAFFHKLMGERPDNLTIDRWPDRRGHYSCGQCPECIAKGWRFNLRWATYKQQMRNMSRNRILTVRGLTGCVAELCEYFGLSPKLVSDRLNRYGWPSEKAFTTPPLRRRLRG